MASSTDQTKFINQDQDENTLLLFTGGKGEPKCVDVNRCLDELSADADIDELGAVNPADKIDFVDACPRVPLSPVTFYFANDASKTYSSFSRSRGIQFSYQAIYKKGFISALAPYSEVAIPPAILSAGTRPLSELVIENTCVLEIPRQSSEVEAIRLIVREGNDGVARRIEDIFLDGSSQNFTLDPGGEFSNFAGYYSFYNDIRGSVMSETDRLKTFDAVPRDAKAQEVAGDRVVYGNYTDGYSNIQTETRLNVSFDQAPPPGYSFDLEAVPVLFRRKTTQYSDAEAASDGLSQERYLTSAGFLLDDANIPNDVGSGVYEINITVSPNNNFHQFLGMADAPNSMENVDINDFVNQPPDANVNPDGIAFPTPASAIGVGSSQSAFAFNDDVLIRDFAIPNRLMNGQGNVAVQGLATGTNLRTHFLASGAASGTENGVLWENTNTSDITSTIGKTCRAPMIYKGGSLSFSAVINVVDTVTKDVFIQSLLHAFWGLDPANNPIVAHNGTQNYPLNDDEWFATHSFDLGINNNDYIDHEESDLSDLIVSVTKSSDASASPMAYGIVNKATLNFCLEPARGNSTSSYFGEDSGAYGKYKYEDENGNQRSLYGLKLTLGNVQDFEFKTCIPFPKAGFGSLIQPEILNATAPNFESFTDNEDKKKAHLFQCRATSPWDYDISSDGTSVQLAWPSIEKNLSIPTTADAFGYVGTADVYGPAKQNFSSAPGWEVTETQIQFVSNDAGTQYPAAGTATGSCIDSDGVFKQRQTLWSDNFFENTVNDGDPVAWMPAPIGRWRVFDDISGATSSTWAAAEYGLSANMTTEATFSLNGNAIDSLVTGRPSTMLRDVSGAWEGKLKNFTETVGSTDYCKFGLYMVTRPMAGDVSTYKSDSPYSLVDGDMGPGGAMQAGTRALGERGSGLGDGWGFPLAMGTHSLNDVDANLSGPNANIKGSVTAFSLVGYTDNFPGYILQNVSRNQPAFGIGTADQLKRLAVSNRVFNHPFYNHQPRYYKSSGSDVSTTIKKSKGPILPYSDSDVLRVAPTFRGVSIPETVPFTSSLFPATNAKLKQVVVPFTGASNGSAMTFNNAQSNTDSASLGTPSFKTKASHEFGIVYYDEKGRHGAVQPIGSVYVPGYDGERTSGLFGAAEIKLDIFHAPPAWAKHYRVVYAGNTTVDEFVQYTIANAFVSPDQASADKIYLSLAHLQSSNISYTSAYGAVSQQDGSDRIYRFAPGDTLRIINYADANGDLVYLDEAYEYKVLGVENLIPSMDDHPLFSENQENAGIPDSDNARNGEFLVIENNSNNINFASGAVSTGSSYWTRRCLVEIYRPKQPLGEDSPYYETNYGGRVIDGSHQYNTIKMRKGDVYFRSVPMNVQLIDGGNFISLVSGSLSNDTSDSNFTPYFVETEGFTDSFISNTKNYGRIHFVDRDASEVSRNYSLTFSEQTSLGSFQPRWLSFPQIGNFKDYSFEFGKIELLDFDGQFINSFHENRVLKIPFQRNVLSTGDTDQIVASTKVLGTEAVIPLESGTANHPESVIKVDGDYFFFDKNKKRVVMLKGGKAPQVITDLGVRTYFKNKVDQWISDNGYKASIGYDPRNEELVVSLALESDSASSSFSGFSGDGGRMMSMSFDLQAKKNWKSRYTFASAMLAHLGENMISFHQGSEGVPQPYFHDSGATRNNFYGQSYGTSLSCAFGGNPNQIKEFETLIVDAEYPWTVNVKSGDEQTTIDKTKFKRYNDRLYGIIDGVTVPEESALYTNRPVSVPTVPRNIYKGKWSASSPEFKVDGGKFFVKMYIPSSHPMFKSPIPMGPTSKLYEKKADGSLISLGKDSRNFAYSISPSSYRISSVSTNRGSGVNEVIFELGVVNPAVNAVITGVIGPGISEDLSGDFDWVSYYSLVDYVSADEAANLQPAFTFVAGTVLPLYSAYISSSSLLTAEDFERLFNSSLQNPAAEYDLNGDGIISTEDVTALLDNFGDGGFSQADFILILSNFGYVIPPGSIPLSEADQVAWMGSFGATELRSIYSLVSNHKEPLIGRNVELELTSDTMDPNSELFSIEVGFNSRNKSMSKAVGQKKKK